MDWLYLLLIPIGIGILVIIVDRGGRRMFTFFMIKEFLVVGNTTRSDEEGHIFWYIPILVNAGIAWSILVGEAKRVKAIITFVPQGTNKQLIRRVPWLNPNLDDSTSVTLEVGSEEEIRLVEDLDGKLFPGGKEDADKLNALEGDYNIILELKNGAYSLGKWYYPKAIIQGSMQEVSSIKISPPSWLKTTVDYVLDLLDIRSYG